MRHGFKLMAAAAAFAMCAGCGGRDLPDLAEVEGTVKLDGQPVSNVLVSFYPQEGGRPGTGVTDDQGHYELVYVDGENGTKPGMNRVEVTMIWPDGEPSPGVKDKVPPAYQGMNSSLSFDVKAGEDNVYNIDRTSK
jgi:hypothetical protein